LAMRALATAMATMWEMATATRLAGNKEGKGNGSKGNAMAMRVVGDKESRGK
jgi:hypothetical protein